MRQAAQRQPRRLPWKLLLFPIFPVVVGLLLLTSTPASAGLLKKPAHKVAKVAVKGAKVVKRAVKATGKFLWAVPIAILGMRSLW